MAGRDIVTIGASASGIFAIRHVGEGLRPDWPGALFAVVHSSPDTPGLLPKVLSSAGRLPASLARESERPVYGRIHVVPPDRHLLLNAGIMQVARGPRENGFRPAIDALFRTAAMQHGTLEENAAFQRRLGDGARRGRLHGLARGHHQRAEDAERRAALIQDALTREPIRGPGEIRARGRHAEKPGNRKARGT